MRLVPKPLLALIGLTTAAAIAGPLFLGEAPSVPDLEKLEEAQRSGEEASGRSDRIRQSVEDIADNLEEGAGISTQGASVPDGP